MPKEIDEQHFVGKVSQRAIIFQDGKFLLTLDVGAKSWGAPGGRLHKEEDAQSGLLREVKEELGIDIAVRGVLHAEMEIYSDGTPVFVVYYAADLFDINQSFVLDPVEVAEAEWFSEAEINSKSLGLWPSVEKAIRLANLNR